MFEEKELEEIHKRLTERLKVYIETVKSMYGQYMPQEKLKQLESINDYSKIIRIHDYGTINAYANDLGISVPLCAEKVLTSMSKIPGYGINKNHKTL